MAIDTLSRDSGSTAGKRAPDPVSAKQGGVPLYALVACGVCRVSRTSSVAITRQGGLGGCLQNLRGSWLYDSRTSSGGSLLGFLVLGIRG